jgi:hypothetical protein
MGTMAHAGDTVDCDAVDNNPLCRGVGIVDVASGSPIRRRQTVGYDEIGDLDLHHLIILV